MREIRFICKKNNITLLKKDNKTFFNLKVQDIHTIITVEVSLSDLADMIIEDDKKIFSMSDRIKRRGLEPLNK